MLKTYTIVRTQLLTHIFFLFDRTGSRRRKSRRREWRQRLDQANSYERFLKIRIEAKDCSMMTSTTTTTAGRMRTTTTHSSTSGAASPPPSSPEMEDAALPPRRLLNGRSLSFSGLSSNRHRHPLLDPPPPSDDDDDLLLGSQAKTTIPRTRSFTNSSSNSSNSTTAGRTNEDLSSVLDMDPIVVQELGRQTADLLVSTTRRLKLALQACLQNQAAAADDGNDEDKRNNIRNSSSSSRISNNIKFRRESTDNSAAVLHYLLAGVVKRNHLQLDDVVIQNARSVAESGQYGLSQCTRNVIRNYYEQVEKCLDYVAEAPDHPFSANGGSQQHQHNGSWSGGGGGRDGFPVVGGGAMDRHSELGDRITLVRKMKQNMGRTALMLSGGTSVGAPMFCY